MGPGTVARYSCDRGFELLGPARRICNSNGTWVPQGIPFCGEYKISKMVLCVLHLLELISRENGRNDRKCEHFCVFFLRIDRQIAECYDNVDAILKVVVLFQENGFALKMNSK